MSAVAGGLVGIGQAAQRAGVSERALRYYQQIGLLTPSGTTPGGMRRYAEADVARVRRIRELQELLGFNLDEIGSLFADEDRLTDLRVRYHAADGDAATRRAVATEALAVRRQLRATVASKIGRLQDFMAEVDAGIERTAAVLDGEQPVVPSPA